MNSAVIDDLVVYSPKPVNMDAVMLTIMDPVKAEVG